MKKGLLFLLAIALVGASIALLLHGTTKGTNWPLLVLLFLPAATWIALKVNFKTDD